MAWLSSEPPNLAQWIQALSVPFTVAITVWIFRSNQRSEKEKQARQFGLQYADRAVDDLCELQKDVRRHFLNPPPLQRDADELSYGILRRISSLSNRLELCAVYGGERAELFGRACFEWYDAVSGGNVSFFGMPPNPVTSPSTLAPQAILINAEGKSEALLSKIDHLRMRLYPTKAGFFRRFFIWSQETTGPGSRPE